LGRCSTQQAGTTGLRRCSDSRNIITDTLTAMGLPQISFLRKQIRKRKAGLNRIDFVMKMATCAVGNISSPVSCIDDIDLNMVADFCDL
ncbi:unnamed protein product, partial [Laminaria digitata]